MNLNYIVNEYKENVIINYWNLITVKIKSNKHGHGGMCRRFLDQIGNLMYYLGELRNDMNLSLLILMQYIYKSW